MQERIATCGAVGKPPRTILIAMQLDSGGAGEGVDLPGKAGNLASRGPPVQGAFASHPGDGRDGALQGRLGLFGVFLGHRLAHLAHHVFDPGFTALIAEPPFLVLSCPFQGG